MQMHGPIPFCGISIEIPKYRIKDWLKIEAINDWNNRTNLRHSRNFINEPIKKNLLFIEEKQTWIKVTYSLFDWSGHEPFKCNLKKKMKLTVDATCRFCNIDDETAEHILCECEVLVYKRHQFLGLGLPSISEYDEVDLEKLLNFFKNINFILGL